MDGLSHRIAHLLGGLGGKQFHDAVLFALVKNSGSSQNTLTGSDTNLGVDFDNRFHGKPLAHLIVG
ncbi:hypothetical protein VT52_026525 [Streptomyces malaysiense]|uniref:Uncharacterized protein n=1 Tax=Streptomyces malaysiense TaxID=1428626 RepID=A0A1J4PV15_9ACTN|nr:hypothetical protein VT52_026525 [Streptomyces malaysiense]